VLGTGVLSQRSLGKRSAPRALYRETPRTLVRIQINPMKHGLVEAVTEWPHSTFIVS
jgi:hypothetical protein